MYGNPESRKRLGRVVSGVLVFIAIGLLGLSGDCVGSTIDAYELDSLTALGRLTEGNRRYVNEVSYPLDLSRERREELTMGQHPFAVIIGCSDSRVPPEHLFNQGLGELFVIRLAGNVVDSLAIGSVEYAVAELDVPLIVVLGHEDCGAVKAAVGAVLDEQQVGGSIDAVMAKIQPVVKDLVATEEGLTSWSRGALYEATTDGNIMAVMEELLARSPIIRQAVDAGDTMIIGAKHCSHGRVEFF